LMKGGGGRGLETHPWGGERRAAGGRRQRRIRFVSLGRDSNQTDGTILNYAWADDKRAPTGQFPQAGAGRTLAGRAEGNSGTRQKTRFGTWGRGSPEGLATPARRRVRQVRPAQVRPGQVGGPPGP